MKKNSLSGNRTLWAGMLICLVVFAANAVAADTIAKPRGNKTALDPVGSKPVWAYSMMSVEATVPIPAIQNQPVKVVAADGTPLVAVPPRPKPRSPFMPPLLNPESIPPWASMN